MNEDINDELFRRAADNYPLKTDTPDWDAVLNKMNNADTAVEPEPALKKRNKNYRYLLLLLLFIPFAIFENKNSFKTGNASDKNNDPKSTGIVKGPTAQTVTTVAPNDDHIETTDQESNSEQKEKINSAAPVNKQSPAVKNNNTNAVNTSVTNDNSTAVNNNNKFSSKQRSGIKIKNTLATADDKNSANSTSSSVTKGNRKNKKTTHSNASIAVTNAGTENDEPLKKEIVSADKDIVQPKKETLVDNTNSKEKETVDKDKTVTPEPKAKQVEKEIAKTTEKTAPKENKNNKSHTKHFYAGLVLAPDLSTIKLQSLKRVGLNYGFILGYKLSKRISIETGLLQDKKYYSTDGQYFSRKNIPLPATETIDHVDGVCKMLELPINVSYTFREKKRSSWFGSLGFSSYFMQHERYTYELNYGGYLYPKDYSYSNKSTSLFAMVNISAGYTYKMGKIGDLRFEPYLKLPVNKIGTGELPIQSAGIFIGFTKLIF